MVALVVSADEFEELRKSAGWIQGQAVAVMLDKNMRA